MVRQHALNGLNTIEFLRHLAASRLLIIWDGSPIHRRITVQDFIDSLNQKIRVERLPGYAPDLNPVEWLWQHLKHVELANVVSRDLEELHLEFHLAIGRIRKRQALTRAFFGNAALA